MKLTAFHLHLKVKPLFLGSTLTTISECGCCMISWSVWSNLPGKYHGFGWEFPEKTLTITKLDTQDRFVSIVICVPFSRFLTLFTSFMGVQDYVTRWLARMCDYFCLKFRAVDVKASLCTPLCGARKEETQIGLNLGPFHLSMLPVMIKQQQEAEQQTRFGWIWINWSWTLK